MSKSRNTRPTHKSPEAAEAAAEAAAVQAAPAAGEAPRSASLDALLKADEAARAPRPTSARKAKSTAPRGPTFLDEVEAALRAAGRPIKVMALTSWWCDTHPDLGDGAKGAAEARATAQAAREHAEAATAAGDAEAAATAAAEAAAADKRAAEAARAQAEATVSARIYTAAALGLRIKRAGKGEVEAAPREGQVAA
jgi:hypothetical protein